MEGVGARLGRSSSRYGTTTVFTGPVRKWMKKWVHVAPPPSNHHNSSATRQHSALANGARNSSSRLVLYRWTPISKDNSADGENKNPNSKEDDSESPSAAADSDEPPRRRLRYIPVAALEEQQKDTEENNEDDESKPDESDTEAAEPTSKSDSQNETPDINDIPMEENQERQDLNKRTLDLSLGLTGRDGEPGSDLNMEPAEEEDD